ncbi:hypothetical protein [Pelotomaculum propionicicum]|uniref:Uncharacterized protein n=1 Tax=Pelotomaculum propionicicum TaxID=258475 RepID=A0A4Y7RWU4_9FIRM|nr:hypothetical protein [Pelotomaculum propionicicum]NLI12733.1 hypothetical protein [Peptococcaceae bacterium]TEB13465.1 hypothetical protein Pmgp_00359 [Pelotomaculum propionicicum]
MPHSILAAAGLAVFSFICNLPLGRWRATVKKFSANWFLAVHLSIPLIIFLRVRLGLSAWDIPLNLAAAVAGQMLGGSQGRSREKQVYTKSLD